ncbi:hypothetical protein WDZ92_09490, partial [Nostoc sp. NIES-2111]
KEERSNDRGSGYMDIDNVIDYLSSLKQKDPDAYDFALNELNIWLHCGTHFYVLEAVKILHRLDVREAMSEIDWIMRKILKFDHSHGASEVVDNILVVLREWRSAT